MSSPMTRPWLRSVISLLEAEQIPYIPAILFPLEALGKSRKNSYIPAHSWSLVESRSRRYLSERKSPRHRDTVCLRSRQLDRRRHV